MKTSPPNVRKLETLIKYTFQEKQIGSNAFSLPKDRDRSLVVEVWELFGCNCTMGTEEITGSQQKSNHKMTVRMSPAKEIARSRLLFFLIAFHTITLI